MDLIYTPEEREEIARNILAYAEAGLVHYYGARNPMLKNEPIAQREFARPMDTTETLWLQVVAEDVRGNILHNA